MHYICSWCAQSKNRAPHAIFHTLWSTHVFIHSEDFKKQKKTAIGKSHLLTEASRPLDSLTTLYLFAEKGEEINRQLQYWAIYKYLNVESRMKKKNLYLAPFAGTTMVLSQCNVMVKVFE